MSRLRPTLEFRRGDELVTCILAEPGAVWFQGHFPDMPLMPGVGLLALVEESVELFWQTATASAVQIREFRRVRFRQRVDPGATLRVRVRQAQPGSLRFIVEVGRWQVCTGECVVASVESARASEPASLASPWAARLATAFSPDGVTVAAVVARGLQLAEIVRASACPRLCVASEDRAEVAAALLAAFAGGIAVVFPPALSSDALVDTFRTAGFSHWLGPADWRPALQNLDAEAIVADWPQAAAPAVRLVDGDPCVFLQTGGTTGQPHLWAKSARNLLAEATFHAQALQVALGDHDDHDDHIVATAAPNHIYGLLFSVLLPLVSGATVERTSAFFPQEIARRIELSRASILVSTPAHLRALASCMSSGHHLRLVLSSGAPLSAADSAEFHARTGLWPLEVYGSTETGGVAVRRQDIADAPWLPLPDVDFRLNDETLCVRSPFVSANASGEDYFVTGDRAEMLAGGTFRLLGRVDGVVKVGGKRVALPEIESALRALAGVSDAVVMALPSESGRGQEIVALAASQRSASDLVRELRERLPSPAWPRRLRCVPAIPITAVGKLDRGAILTLLATAPIQEP
jgi:acyl-coenzyme A synthetase/AMP-(fatty) acid ligase/3-hydroxymyristoyl/3-hydroxydecanoyl-(acyl carrier protein) dehydratase